MGYWDIVIPSKLVNYVTNPSFELGTTGYSTGGTNTIAQSSEQARRGIYSLKGTYSNDGEIVLLTVSGLTGSTAYTWSFDLYVPTGVTGTLSTFIDSTTLTAITVSANDTWFRVERTFTSGGTSATLDILWTSTPAGSIYVDGYQLVPYSGEVTYIDGDQPGARWIGAPHASKSESDGYEPALGYYLNLADDLHFRNANQQGAGMPKVNNLSSPLALQPGMLHDDQTIDTRDLMLSGTLIGDSVATWHTRRQALIKALNSKTTRINRKSLPRVLRVTSPAIPKHISAVYDSGLEGGLPDGFTEKDINLKLLCDDPLFYDTGETSAVLDTHDSGTFTGIAARLDGAWSNLGPPNASGTYDTVRDVLIHQGKIYITGTFSNWDNIANADNIAVYDIDAGTWAAMGTGLDDLGRVLIADAAGNVYVGGNFTTAGGTTCRGVAMWDGATWNALGPPSSGGGVWSLAIHPLTGDLYVGGSFENWDGTANSDRIVYWDGSAWNSLSTGISTASSIVRALVFDETGLLYLGGDFESPEARIMTWDGSSFTNVGNGLGSSTESVNALIIHDGLVYAGGDFTGPPNYLAYWNGATWRAFPKEVNDNVIDLIIDRRGDLYAVGYFTTAGDLDDVEKVALWNGSSWSRIDIDFPTDADPFCIDVDSNDTIVIGTDDDSYTAGYAGTTTIDYIGTYNAYPIFELTRDGGTFATLITLQNWTTGARLYCDYDLLDGETVTIDFRPGHERVTSSLRGNIPYAIFSNSNLGQFYLMPGNASGATENKITCFVQTTGGDPSLVVASLRWKDAYISED